jgi:cystatin-C
MNKAPSLRLTVLLGACLWSVVVAANDFVPKILPGGYGPVELNSRARAAADFAVAEQAKREAMSLKLMSVSRAEKQIVAGTNYRLVLIVERAGSTRQAKVMVFQDLKARYWLKSWEWL